MAGTGSRAPRERVSAAHVQHMMGAQRFGTGRYSGGRQARTASTRDVGYASSAAYSFWSATTAISCITWICSHPPLSQVESGRTVYAVGWARLLRWDHCHGGNAPYVPRKQRTIHGPDGTHGRWRQLFPPGSLRLYAPQMKLRCSLDHFYERAEF